MANLTKKFTKEMLLKALPNTGGLRSAIAQNMGCHRNTVVNLIRDNPELLDAIHQEEESIGDLAESKLFKEINVGNMTAIIFYLKTKCKNRGYIERFENKIEYDIEELKALSNDELLSLHKRLKNIK